MTHRRKVVVRKRIRQRRALIRLIGEDEYQYLMAEFVKYYKEEMDKVILYGNGTALVMGVNSQYSYVEESE